MTDELRDTIKSAVKEAIDEHTCWMNEEERVMVKDLIAGGRMVKRSILAVLAGGVLYVLAKLAGLSFFK